MSRTTRRAATILAGAAVVLSSFSVAQAQTLTESITTAQQGIQVTNQGAQLANQFSSLSSSSDKGGNKAPSTPTAPANPVGGKLLNSYNQTVSINGVKYQFSSASRYSSDRLSWQLDEPFTRATATIGFVDNEAPVGYKANVVVRADGTIIREFEVTPDKPHKLDVKLNQPSNLRIDWTITNHADERASNSRFAIGSPKVYY